MNVRTTLDAADSGVTLLSAPGGDAFQDVSRHVGTVRHVAAFVTVFADVAPPRRCRVVVPRLVLSRRESTPF